MTKNADYLSDLRKLRKDFAALRRHGENSEPHTNSESPSDQFSADTMIEASIETYKQELETLFTELSRTVEDEISEKPMVSVGAAFILGFLAGRSSAH